MPLSGVAVAIGRNSFDPPAPVVPVFDIHARELDLHDLNSPASDPPERAAGSGILAFHAKRNHLILNPSTSGAAAVCTAVFFDGYNTTGGLMANSFGPGTTIPIDATRSTSSVEDFTLASSVVTVWASGTYEITVRAGTDTVSSTRLIMRHRLEHSSGGGAFAEVPGSNHWTMCRSSTNGEDSSLCTIVLQDVAPGDQFRIKSSELSTSMIAPIGPSYVANGYGLTFVKLE